MEMHLHELIAETTKEPVVASDSNVPTSAGSASYAALSTEWARWMMMAHQSAYLQHAANLQARNVKAQGCLCARDVDCNRIPRGEEACTPSTSAASSPRSTGRLQPLSPGLLIHSPSSFCLSPLAANKGEPPHQVDPFPMTPPGLPSRSGVPVGNSLVQMPPGFRPPPGLPHPAGLVFVPTPPATEPGNTTTSPRSSTSPDSKGTKATNDAEWRIKGVFGKLKASGGYALVSPSMHAAGVGDVRMHFIPGAAWSSSARGTKNKSGTSDNFRNGAIRLKVEGAKKGVTHKFSLVVGGVYQGPVVCDFADRAVHEIPLRMDWRKHLEAGTQDLVLSVNLLE